MKRLLPISSKVQPQGFVPRTFTVLAVATALILGASCSHFRPPSAEDKLNRKSELKKEKMDMHESVDTQWTGEQPTRSNR